MSNKYRNHLVAAATLAPLPAQTTTQPSPGPLLVQPCGIWHAARLSSRGSNGCHSYCPDARYGSRQSC